MRRSTTTELSITLALLTIMASAGCSRKAVAPQSSAGISPAASEQNSPVKGNETTMVAVRFLEDRVRNDPDDLVALNKLAGYYLQLHRETDDVKYLKLSLR